MKRINICLVSAILATTTLGRAAEPTTTKSSAGVVESDQNFFRENGTRAAWAFSSNVKIRLAEGVEQPTLQEWAIVLGYAHWPLPGHPEIELQGAASTLNGIGNDTILNCGALVRETQADAMRKAMVPKPVASKPLWDWLGHLVTSDNGISPDERRNRLEKLQQELEQIKTAKGVLQTLVDAQPSRNEALTERIKALRAEKERLEMMRSAKEARRMALDMGIGTQQMAVDKVKDSDPVAAELSSVVKLRETEIKLIEAQYKLGTATATDLTAAQAKLAEAKAQLADRQAVVIKTGKGAILDRLADEMALVTVDLTDIRLQMHTIDEELAKLNPAAATTQSLETLVKDGTAPPVAGTLPPLFYELDRKERDLIRQKVILEVDDIEPVADANR